MEIIIIDDEPQAIRALRTMLKTLFQDVNIIATAESVAEGVQVLAKHTPDLLFLDIKMPDGDGFELLNTLQDKKIPVVFATAYDQYAIKAFRYSAVDYLLKPIDPDLLKEVVEKVKVQKEKHSLSSSMKVLEKHMRNPGSRYITLPSSHEHYVVQTQEIVRFEGAGSYVNICLRDGERHVVAKVIGYYQELLEGNGFFRIHQSHMVNLSCVAKLTKGKNMLVELNDGTLLPVAVRRRKEFKQALIEYDE